MAAGYSPPSRGAFDPAAPTDAPPGSARKILVMTARAAAGLPLFHTGDEDDTPPPAAPTAFRGARAGRRSLPPGVRRRGRRFQARTLDAAQRNLGLWATPEEAAWAVAHPAEALALLSPRRLAA